MSTRRDWLTLVGVFSWLRGPLFGQVQERPRNPTAQIDEMTALVGLVGRWDLQLSLRDPTTKTWAAVKTEPLVIISEMRGRFVRMTVVMYQGDTSVQTDFWWGFDRFQRRYRVVAMDDRMGLLDSSEGVMTGTAIVVNNVKAGTFWPMPGQPSQHILAEITLELRGANGLRLSQRGTIDDGRTWFPMYEGEARRQ